ncbi:DUF3040 domain-containing protein [Pseudonocardia sp. 73-21]|jgi:lysylphosphatidylglycerol synthetase-like protein (DUF2156 family)|uniref:DUF3040 domain-containing protein n=1 Tax=Pseudonocardia sp. 73-21 TaxID=1895809 RepID=UPI0009592AA4|nr:DUF3040 domain-containing protein [Pseudonocardia sp. 73-21]OJY51982.1 MAG: hypothetical protein BGP03_07995 [Pseudonocardia sp. 73-21]
MLSERDKRILREIEQQFTGEERRLASLTRSAQRSERRLHRAADAALIVAALAAVLCFALATAVTVGAGAVAMVLFVLLALRSGGDRRTAIARAWQTVTRTAR